jgi:glycosyltransferase involved in cell wall biosynthesis
VVPSSYAAGQAALLGVPADRLEVLPHYLPAEAFAEHSRAGEGSYALVVSRLSPEKGIDSAIEAAALTGIPLRIAGEGPAALELAERAQLSGAAVEFLGRLDRPSLARELAGAAMLLMPSRYHEFAPYSALESMAAGVPVVASALGGLPELLGAERCVPPGDPVPLAARMAALWESPQLRRTEGDELIARARAGHSEERYVSVLLDVYSRSRQ